MLYFSEIKNKRVVTENGVVVGKLQDFIFLAAENPQVTKIVIQDFQNNKHIIPIANLKKINSVITLTGNYHTTLVENNELFVEKNLLDKQIIDIGGNKIVRVNDVVLQNKPPLYVSGVDIGLLGILRWFKLESLKSLLYKFTGVSLTSKFLSWGDIQPLELARGMVKLKKEESKLEKVKPEDLADYLERTTISNISKFLNVLDEKFAVNVFTNLNLNYQSSLLRAFAFPKSAKIISLIDPDEAVDILLTFSQKRRDHIISLLDGQKQKDILYLIKLSKTPIGKHITSEYISVAPEYTVDKVFKIIKEKTADFTFLDYVYVVNKENHLVGVFNLHELLLQNEDIPVYKFMVQNVIVAHLSTPEEIVIKKMAKYKIQALPVIDDKKHMLGIVPFDYISECLLESIK